VSENSKLWMLAVAGLVFAQAIASLLLLSQNFQLIVLSDITQCVLLLSATAAVLRNALNERGRTRLFWFLMTLGMAFWLSYQLLWIYFEVLLRTDVPNPFVGDIVIFIHIVPMMAALVLQPHSKRDDPTSRLGTLDFVLLLVWWVYLYVFTVIPWQYAHYDELAYGRNLNAIYLTEKLVLLVGLAALWLRSKGTWSKIYAHWFGASLMYAVSSYLANWAIQKQFYYTGSLYDVPLAVSIGWVTAIGVLAHDSPPKQEEGAKPRGHGIWVARLGMIAIFSLPLFAAWAIANIAAPPRVRTFRIVLTLVAMIVLGAMVFLRQHLLDRELLRLIRTSRESFDNLQRLQGQLVQSEKLASLGQLVAGAAHELNNPLTAMLGYSELLIATPMDSEQRAVAERIGQHVRRTKALVSSLLSFARQGPTDKTVIDPNTLAQTALKLAQPELQALKIEAKFDPELQLPKILGDSNQLLQVCLHLIANANHAVEEVGGLLTVTTRKVNDFVCLEFSSRAETGAPEPSAVNSISVAKPMGQDSGMGLSACYGIVNEHSGRILCQNRPNGALFRIELPANDASSFTASERRQYLSSWKNADSREKTGVALPLRPTP
jgi:signal transduction histidine kinase